MDSWARLEAGLPLLGRIHSLLLPLVVSQAGRYAPASNHIEPHEVLGGVQPGIRTIREWGASPVEVALIRAAEALTRGLGRRK